MKLIDIDLKEKNLLLSNGGGYVMPDHTSSFKILHETRPWVCSAWATFQFLTKKRNVIKGVTLNKINFYFKIKDFSSLFFSKFDFSFWKKKSFPSF